MPVDRKKIEALLKWYQQEIGPDLIAVIIVNRDGFVIDSLMSDNNKSVEEESSKRKYAKKGIGIVPPDGGIGYPLRWKHKFPTSRI